ncbi:hypothetical protein FISHEDRAFT_65771 [Fistulina hepatica ATCC 64428]|uniref:RNA polymerase Rpb7-like N-terminal domain-containing protein n=1 Tax=Fistulina hepatica ATCC 64428 TaxID=1128425 RepID=A0A0D7ABY3_9AGAR|nr:hypothetical protein FISHEDRAFT_65771 [Fistulina hepatica ATCC 64428]
MQLPLARMFSIKELTHTILLQPSYFGPRMVNFLESKLYADAEGTCSAQFGYIIAVVSLIDIGKGIVLSGSGQAEFITRHRAVVFKPFKGEVVDGIVDRVTKVRYRRENTKVRLKIVGTRADATEVFAIGTIKEDHLGVIE